MSECSICHERGTRGPSVGASELVCKAYSGRLSPIAIGLTDKDRRALRAAVKRGELVYRQDLNLPGKWMYWEARQ